MPFSGGVFTPTINWVTEQASPPIETAKLDAQDVDMAAGLSNCILRDGTGIPTAAINWNNQNLSGVNVLTTTVLTVNGVSTFNSGITGTTLTASGMVTAGGVNVTSSIPPANGFYLSGSNTLAITSGSTLRGNVASNGTWTLAAPSSSSTLVLYAISSGTALTATDGTREFILSFAGSAVQFGSANSQPVNIVCGGSTRLTITSAGNTTVAAPSSGTALTINGVSGAHAAALACGSAAANFGFGWNIGLASNHWNVYTQSTDPLSIGTSGAAEFRVYTNGASRLIITSGGAATFSGSLAVTGATTLSSTLAVTGTTTLADATATTPAEGDSDNSVATTAFVDPARSHAASGYQKLSSGLVLQWGESASVSTNASGSVTFPVAFASVCYMATATPNSTTTSNQFGHALGGIGTTGFTIYNQGRTSSTFYWWAIGK